MAHKIIKFINSCIDYSILIILIVMFCYGIYSLYDSFKVYDNAKLSKEIQHLKPDGQNNKDHIDKLKEFDENIFAWIQINNTEVDYPVVKGKDNTEYLKKDYEGNYSVSGSIFLDYRNNTDFSDFYNIIYGHHMSNKSMFGDLDKFKKKDFFDNNKTGKIFLENETYEFEIFATATVSAYDSMVYMPGKFSNAEKNNLINHIKNNATFYREVDLDESSTILALSTCTYDIANARYIVFAKMIK